MDPKKLLFLVFDGTIPAALFLKLNFKILDVGNQENSPVTTYTFLPGNPQSIEFDNIMKESLKTLIKESGDIKIIYSGLRVPGDS